MELKNIVVYLVLGLILLPFVTYSVGPFFPQYEAFTVSSGSMSPQVPKGSIIYTTPVSPEKLDKGDVITYRSAADYTYTTHRIVEVVDNRSELAFRTMGDANEDVDPGLVLAEDVVGKVRLSLPVLGDVVSFARTSFGALILVIFPAVALTMRELFSIYREVGNKDGVR